MDWFTRLTAFKEDSYDKARAQPEVNGSTLRSKANDRSYGIGTFDLDVRLVSYGAPSPATRNVTGELT